MLNNYLKVAIRTLFKNKVFSFINIAGLAIGISTCLLITLYVLDELSYDTFHEKAHRIYRVTELLHLPTEVRAQTVTSPPIAPALKDNFPEVLKTVRLSRSTRTLAHGNKKFYDTKVWYADSTLFDIFTFPMIKGNPSKALVNPYSIVLTEDAAKKYFGEDDPFGKNMIFSDSLVLTVTGIIKNIPPNSHIQFDVVMSRTTINALFNNEPEDNWFSNGYYTYILLPEAYDYKQLEAKFPAFLETAMAEPKKQFGLWYDFVLQPLTSIHLYSTAPFDMSPNGSIKYVYTFSVVAVLVLLIACANYINLSTARSMNRAKELGMRKVIGARRKQIIVQLFGESLLLTLIAFVLSLAVVTSVLPAFNTITHKAIDVSFLLTREVMATAIGMLLLIGLLAGAYPAIMMSSFSPIKTFKNYVRQGRESNFLRKGLVVFQFTLSIILITGTVLIFRQMHFMQTQNLGLNKEQIVQLRMRTSVTSKHQLIKDEMSNVPGVVATSVGDFSYSEGISNIGMRPEGVPENELTSEAVISVDPDFLPMFNIQLIAGRNFSKDFPTDVRGAFILNETAVKHFNWGDPETALGKTIYWNADTGKVVGVVRDFNFYSLHENIKPLVIHILPDWYRFVSVKISGSHIPETIAALEAAWNKLNLDSPFDYSFLDQDFEKLYKAEQQTQTIIGLFSGLAIFIACLGLFGLAAFTAEQRTKEIGVRKIMGADVFNIIRLLSTDFLKLVFLAIAFAVPIAWYAANQWLESFAYRIEISWWIFCISGCAAILIALFTVSFQSIKAALANPVDSLRNE